MVLNATAALEEPGRVMRSLESIGVPQRRAARAQIAKLVPGLHYTTDPGEGANRIIRQVLRRDRSAHMQKEHVDELGGSNETLRATPAAEPR